MGIMGPLPSQDVAVEQCCGTYWVALQLTTHFKRVISYAQNMYEGLSSSFENMILTLKALSIVNLFGANMGVTMEILLR